MVEGTRERIVEVAAGLLASGGPSAVTTRAVAAAAGVQAPTIYRQFGDKDGLLQAVADRVFAVYVAGKRVREELDPVDELCEAFAAHIAFGLANPGLTALFSDPLRPRSGTEDAGVAVLRERVHRIALAGRLRVPEERAVALMHAIGVGVVLGLVGTPEPDRDPALADAAWNALASVVLVPDPDDAAPEGDGGTVGTVAAAALRLCADEDALGALGPAERPLMREWLGRIADKST